MSPVLLDLPTLRPGRSMLGGMSAPLSHRIREVEATLRRGRIEEARRLLGAVRRDLGSLQVTSADTARTLDRHEELLARTVQITLARGLEPVSHKILDGMTEIMGASRGFVGLIQGEGWRFLAARNLAQADIDRPESQVSTGIIQEALESGLPVVSHNASSDFAERASIQKLDLQSVICLPLLDGDSVAGFVYLDNPDTVGLFDDAAVAAAKAWLPVVNSVVSRALAEQSPDRSLSEMVTRSPRLQAELEELARIAVFDVPILLTGETGTGKSFLARQLHSASGSSGPFVQVNCGAIPEALLESELFGHKKGAFTGATADRDGRFVAAQGGTLFLDELDSMPLACQVKLLVALQDRCITPLGSDAPVDVDVRVISAMGSDPFVAIDDGRLREDLYYRLSVFVGNLPPLRERMEDVPLLAAHFLEQTRERYSLPPMSLSEQALESLLTHTWPGNVRELGNVLDRAALLARDGVIEQIRFRGRRREGASTGASGILPTLEVAGKRMLAAMETHEELRRWETAEALKSIVLLQAVHARGKDEGFEFLGLDSLVRNRNHHRAFRREATRLQELAALLGEHLGAELTELSDT